MGGGGTVERVSGRRATPSVDIEVGSGETRRFGPGTILLAEDLTGQGHISRSVDGEARTCLFVHLD